MKRLVVLVALLAVSSCFATAPAGPSPHAENQPIIDAPAKGKDMDPAPPNVAGREAIKKMKNPPVAEGVISPPARGETEREQIHSQFKLMHDAYLKQLEEERRDHYLPPVSDAPPAGSGTTETDENEDKLAKPKETVPSYPNVKNMPSPKAVDQPDLPPTADAPAGKKGAKISLLQESGDDIQSLFAKEAEEKKNAIPSAGLPVLDAPGDEAASVVPKPSLRGPPKQKKWAPRKVHSDLPTIDSPDADDAQEVVKQAPAVVVDQHPYRTWEKNAEAARAKASGFAVPVSVPGNDAAVTVVPKPVAKKVDVDEDKWVNNVSAEMHESSFPVATVGDDVGRVAVPAAVPTPVKKGPSKWDHNVDADVKFKAALPVLDSPGGDAPEVVPTAVAVKAKAYKGEPSPPHIPAPTRQWDN